MFEAERTEKTTGTRPFSRALAVRRLVRTTAGLLLLAGVACDSAGAGGPGGADAGFGVDAPRLLDGGSGDQGRGPADLGRPVDLAEPQDGVRRIDTPGAGHEDGGEEDAGDVTAAVEPIDVPGPDAQEDVVPPTDLLSPGDVPLATDTGGDTGVEDVGEPAPDVDEGEGCGPVPEGAPCDDGLACTVDDVCTEGRCAGRAEHGRCDDGLACTTDLCVVAEGGCTHRPESGRPCAGAAVCDEGVCVEGQCELFDDCDDGRICTVGACDPAGGCAYAPVSHVDQPAPTFVLGDANPESETFGEILAVPGPGPRVVVILFHDSECFSCREQGEAARPIYAALADQEDLLWIAINGRLSEGSIDAYVYFDSDGEGPEASTWPFLMDEAGQRVWDRFCADNNDVAIVHRDGFVRYYREVNFRDARFADELRRAVEDGLRAP